MRCVPTAHLTDTLPVFWGPRLKPSRVVLGVQVAGGEGRDWNPPYLFFLPTSVPLSSKGRFSVSSAGYQDKEALEYSL